MSDFSIPTQEINLEQMISAVDFCDILYFALPNNGLGHSGDGRSLSSERVRRLISELLYISSSERASIFALELKSLMACNPALAAKEYDKHKLLRGVYLIDEYGEHKIEQWICRVLTSTGYKSVACYSSSYGDDDFVGIFFILSDVNLVDLKRKLNQPWIFPYFDLLNFYCPRASASINRAIYNPSNIPNKTLDVLRLSSRGESIKSISEKLFITTRGVEYHLEKAKHLLNASNKAELISVAKNCCLI